MSGSGMLFAVSASGHRGPYLELLGAPLELTPTIGPAGPRSLPSLIRAPRLLLATLDDDLAWFALAALIRAMLGRSTVALYLAPQKCFNTARLKDRARYWCFRLLRRLPHLRLLTIIPFEFEPQLAAVAHDGVFDPQWWDMLRNGAVPPPRQTELSKAIVAQANGRTILTLVGHLQTGKGFGFFADILVHDPGMAEKFLFVGAGKLPAQSLESAARFVAAGGLVLDRLLSDEEIESMYGAADLIWCCYAPAYDQSSGIFGRAVQFGVPAIVRSGSLIEKIAGSLGIGVVPLDYGDAVGACALLRQTMPEKLDAAAMSARVTRLVEWRRHFLDVVLLHLAIPKNRRKNP